MLPKAGKKLHGGGNGTYHTTRFARVVAGALRTELGQTHRAVKTVMRWTGAGERTVKHWFAGTHGPSGAHLAALVQHSDSVLAEFLRLAGRETPMLKIELSTMRAKLVGLVALIDR